MNALPFPKKDGEPCTECRGSGRTRYYSETITGDIEEAFRLCERCKYKRRLPCDAGSATPCRSTKSSMRGYKGWRNFREFDF
jgi:DnaJ-class molecular chaperone